MPIFRRDPERRAERQLDRAERQRRAAETRRQAAKEQGQRRKIREEASAARGRPALDWDTVGDVAGKVGETFSDVFGGNKSAEVIGAEPETNEVLWILGGVGAAAAVGVVAYMASRPSKRRKR